MFLKPLNILKVSSNRRVGGITGLHTKNNLQINALISHKEKLLYNYLLYLNKLSVDGKRTFSFPLLGASGKL